jgi:GxxExxY protein
MTQFDAASNDVIGCCLEVHRALGPGLLESIYQRCLAYEFQQRGIPFRAEHALPVRYKEVELDCGVRADFLIGEILVVELKSVDQLKPVHEAQLLTYMKLASASTGLLINFNVARLKDGIRRFVL